RIPWHDVEEQRAEQRRGANRGDRPDEDADGDQTSRFSDNQPRDRSALRAERHAHADLARTPSDRVRHDTIEPDDAEQPRDDGERADAPHAPAPQLRPPRT